ncbi:MAG: hypothetical protein JSU85_14260 [Candidatus Zixiibacteriota bacterium]|nr:MAG: hypothetical protein JSU85_14260 [candidate division Zixibacteria bacterium]
MIIKTTFLILIIFVSISYGDFDDSVIWKYYIPEPGNDGRNFIINRDGLKSTFLHSNLYGVESLNWNFISMRYNKGAAGFGMEFSTVGYKEYYRRNKYRARIEYRLHENVGIAPLFEITNEEFQDFGRHTGISGEFFIGYTRRNYYAGLGFAEIQFKEPYNKSRNDGLKPFVINSWIFNEGLTLSIGIRRFENRRTRWIFDQCVSVNGNLALNFGYKNNPSDIYGGLLLTVRKFSFTITYSSVSGLSDSVIWGISFRG